MSSELRVERTGKMTAPIRKVQLENIPVNPGMTKEYAPGFHPRSDHPPSFSRTSRRSSHRPSFAIRRDIAALFKLFDADENTRSAILVDLYFNTLAYATKSGFNTEKSSTLLAIVKAVHEKATRELQTIGNSFEFFKLLMLQSSVHRPPYSLGIFTFAEMKDLTEYMLSTYFRHYKLYQYAFTKLVRMDVKLAAPVLETAPTPFELLGLAFTDAEWEEKQAEIKAKIEEEKRKAEEEAAAKEEAEREARIKAEYDAAIPEEVSTRVSEALEQSMKEMKEQLEARFKEQEEALLAKIAELEAK